MNANEFVKIVRSGSEKLRVDEVVVYTGNQELHGKGMLRICRQQIEIEITINKGEIVPEVPSGTYTKSDLWKLTGVIEDQLQFKCDHVWPHGYSSMAWPSGITKCKFDLHPIDLVPSGWDSMSRIARNEYLKHHQASNSSTEDSSDQLNPEDEVQDDFVFQATLFEYPLIRTTPGNEVKGETDRYEFILAKEESTSDLHVTLKSKKNCHSSGEEEDWKIFHAFMNALAFTNGIHAWPYRIEYWRAGQKITDRVTSADKLARTSHSPFSDRLAFSAQTGSLKWNFQDPLKLAAAFFEKDTPLSKEVSIIFFLFREADEGVHSEITTIALCTLFENLVRLIFKELNLREKLETEDLKLFETAKLEIADLLNQQIEQKGEGYRRLHNVVRTAQLFSIEQIFQAVTSHFGLKWQGDMEKILRTWKQARNPLVHDKARSDVSEAELKSSVASESQIAGAINILLLKLMGYSGFMQHSALEDGYRQI